MARKDTNQGKAEAAEERKIKAFELRKQARSYRDIARELGVSECQAFNDIREVLQRLQAQSLQMAGQYVEMEDQRLGMVIAALTPKVLDGDTQACLAFIRALESRRKLLGIDAPDVVKVLGDYANLSNEQLYAIATTGSADNSLPARTAGETPTVN